MRFGAYQRKKAGVAIQRFRCKKCERYFGWLPPFLLPCKHYTIPEIEPGIEAYVAGSSGYTKVFQTMTELPCCQETLWRWVGALAGLAEALCAIARTTLAKLKPNFKVEKDRRLFTADFPASRLKGKNDGLNLLSQIFILRDYFGSEVAPADFLVWLIFQKRLATRPKPKTTRFADDRNGTKRDNGTRAGPKRRRSSQNGASQSNGGKKP